MGEAKYRRDATATLAAVQRWQRYNPELEPKLPPPHGIAVISSLRPAIVALELSDPAALKLANYVAGQVADATWLMFYGAWEAVYSDDMPAPKGRKSN